MPMKSQLIVVDGTSIGIACTRVEVEPCSAEAGCCRKPGDASVGGAVKAPRCRYCRPGDPPPRWGVSCIAYAHTAGELVHYCTSGQRVTIGVDELTGEERAYAERLVGASASASRANAAAYRAGHE